MRRVLTTRKDKCTTYITNITQVGRQLQVSDVINCRFTILRSDYAFLRFFNSATFSLMKIVCSQNFVVSVFVNRFVFVDYSGTFKIIVFFVIGRLII